MTTAKIDGTTMTPRERQRAAEDAIDEIAERFHVRIMGVIKTVTGGQQLITWEAVPLPDDNE